MPLGNYAEPEVAVTAAVVAVAASPSIRQVVRRSVVYGLAGALLAYDRTTEAARGIGKGLRRGASDIATHTPAAASEAVVAPPPPQPSAI